MCCYMSFSIWVGDGVGRKIWVGKMEKQFPKEFLHNFHLWETCVRICCRRSELSSYLNFYLGFPVVDVRKDIWSDVLYRILSVNGRERKVVTVQFL